MSLPWDMQGWTAQAPSAPQSVPAAVTGNEAINSQRAAYFALLQKVTNIELTESSSQTVRYSPLRVKENENFPRSYLKSTGYYK